MTVQELYKSRDVNTPNLCFIVSNHMEFVVGPTEANIFKTDPMIRSVWDNVPVIQVVALNRYFHNLLMRFRAKINIPVHDTAFMLLHDGSVDDWFWSFSKNVCPFLKEKNVFGVVFSLPDENSMTNTKK